MKLKQATINDLETIVYLEQTCFKETEAASYEELKKRLETYSKGYDILYLDHQAIGYIGGLKNDCLELKDEMYHDSSLHKEEGFYQTIFSVCILEDYRRLGYASYMVKEYVKRRQNMKGFVLTCKDYLIPFYTSCGFTFEKISDSTHGNEKWNDMILKI